MKQFLGLVTILIGSSIPPAFPAQTPSQRFDLQRFVTARYHARRLIVKHRGETFPHAVAIPEGSDVIQRLTLLQYDGSVEYAEPDLLYTAERIVPSDPYFTNLWGLEAINAPDAWGFTGGSDAIVVAVIDTGVDYTHPDLQRNIWVNEKEIPDNGKDDDNNGYIDDVYGWNPLNPTKPPLDDNKHGTHVAGIIGAVGNNELGVVGVNWQVKIMPLKFLDKDGSGYLSDAIRAIEYVLLMKQRGVNIRVVNASWGSDTPSRALDDAIQKLRAQDILFVAAAGNNGTTAKTYPGASDLVLSVAATEQGGTLAPFSNFGPWVDVAAPGRSILSTVPGGGYASFSGTSMATPHVAGLAALALSMKPTLTADQLEQAIRENVAVIPGFKDKVNTSGIIDAAATIRQIATHAGPPCEGNCPPTVTLTASSLYVDNGQQITLTATASDPDNDPLSYRWTATDGTLTAQIGSAILDTTGVNPTLGAAPVTVIVTVTVEDGQGHTASASRSITVRSPNQSPQVTLEASPTTVPDGGLVSLTATGRDPDGDDLTYSWKTTAGSLLGSGTSVYLDTTGVNPTPDAPPMTVTVTVSVSDGRGATTTAEQRITVTAPAKISISAFPTSVKFANGKASFYLLVKKHKSYKGSVQLQMIVSEGGSDLTASILSGGFLFYTHRVVVTLKSPPSGPERYRVLIRGTSDDGKSYDSNGVILTRS